MWGNPKGVTEADIARRIAKGFGQGVGIDYVPWIQKHDFSSEGVAKELNGILIPRPYHLLSKLEYKVYLPIERMKDVVDIREQFPLLDRELVVHIANKMGCRCPYFYPTRTVYVMTTDLLVTYNTPSGLRLQAIAIKPNSQLEDRRILELLEIERRYWKEYKVEWRLATEAETDRNLWINLRWLRQQANLDKTLMQPGLKEIFLLALSRVDWSGRPLKAILNQVARIIDIPQESCVSLFKYNTWYGNIDVDLYSRLKLTGPLRFLTVHPVDGGAM
jgi:hypothetical protein